MRMSEVCAGCLYRRQMSILGDPAYLAEIRSIIENRGEDDCAPYLVYLFDRVQERLLGERRPFGEIKRRYNDLVLSLEDTLKTRIASSPDPLETAFLFSRIGNYIDFGAMDDVDETTFLALFDDAVLSPGDRGTMDVFLSRCASGRRFLLIADNCGEIVLDKLFLQQLKERFAHLELAVMVRGDEVLNDATAEDAVYVGLDRVARIVSNGTAIAGTVCRLLSPEAQDVLCTADVILAKGQGNYESLCGHGFDVFYSFLCKCDLFSGRFHVPKLTGMFIEEG